MADALHEVVQWGVQAVGPWEFEALIPHAPKENEMDVTTMTLKELETELDTVIESEDIFGRPDIHTEDWIRDEIELRKKGPKVSIYGRVRY